MIWKSRTFIPAGTLLPLLPSNNTQPLRFPKLYSKTCISFVASITLSILEFNVN